MAFNVSHIRALRTAKNAAVATKRPSNFKNLPFVEPRELLDGEYRIRLWPADNTKNPFGYLFYKTHNLITWDGKPFSHQCPRSNNWDPLPIHWENAEGAQFEDPDPDEVKEHNLFPVYRERCWACETEAQFVDVGLELDKLPEVYLHDSNGKPLPIGTDKDGNPLFLNLQSWATKMLGTEAYHFPCTICMSIAGVVKETGWDGKQRDATDYKEDKQARFHCDLSLKEGKLKNDLLTLIEECPDCSHILAGRWFVLTKKNEGKGAGGYEIRIAPNPSPAGFDLPTQGYPNYVNWGKGNPQFNRPTHRYNYHEVEALGADPRGFWVKPLQDLGIVLSDDAPF